MASRRWTFTGRILGVGTTSGVRVVVGMWDDSPLGPFADVMVERADGHRLLLAPSREVADFVAGTYTFDETRVERVEARCEDGAGPVGGHGRGHGRVQVTTPSLVLRADLGRRTPLGRLLRGLPAPLAARPVVSTVTDPVARVALRGMRTRGSAGGGRREYYGATDVHSVVSAEVRLEGQDLGALAPVEPPTRFGFSSTPRRPGLTRVVTTVVERR